MTVTLALGLPRTGRPAMSILSAGFLSRLKVSRRARVLLSFEMRRSTFCERAPRESMTGRVSYPGNWLGVRWPTATLMSGGMLSWERTVTSIRRDRPGSAGAAVDWALQPAARATASRPAMNRKRNKSGILSVQDTPATGFGGDPQEWTLGTGKRDPGSSGSRLRVSRSLQQAGNQLVTP